MLVLPATYERSGKYHDTDGHAVKRSMPTARILSLLDEAVALGFHGDVAFHHFSEPLLDARSTVLAEAARGRGCAPIS